MLFLTFIKSISCFSKKKIFFLIRVVKGQVTIQFTKSSICIKQDIFMTSAVTVLYFKHKNCYLHNTFLTKVLAILN